jgi:tetratricopeptide (TPR) repeat protein
MNGKNVLAGAAQANEDLNNLLRELPIRSKFPRPAILALTSISKPESIDVQADNADFRQEEGIYPCGVDSCGSTLGAYNGVHRMGPDDVLALLDEGEVLDILGRDDHASECFRMAVKLCDEALKVDPDDANAWWYKAEGLLGLGMFKEAAEAYNRIIEMDPYDFHARANKSLVLLQLKMDNESLDAFDNILLH